MEHPTPQTALDGPLARTLTPDAESDDLIGVTLHDTYEIRAVLGEGGMGKVYEAHHTRIRGKRFAIKVLRTEMAHSPEVRTRFQREADAAASINHPNVVAVNDFGYAPDGRPYIVYDYLEGWALSDLIKERKHIELGIAIYICRQVCRALQAAHDKTVIHRDLKPDNIYLLGPKERPDVKVLDFGLSRFMASTTRNNVTRAGVVMGTPSFMAPEQARAEATDHRCDIYGVGVLLYSSLTGYPPFDGESPADIVLAVMTQEPTPPRAHAPWIPEQLELVIQRAMARDPAQRYQTMAELDVALSPFDVLTKRYGPSFGGMSSPAHDAKVDEVDAVSAPTQVVLLLVCALLVLLVGTVTALSGASELLSMARPLSTTAFALIFGAAAATLLVSFVLLLRWMRRELWNDRQRMVALVPRIKAPLLAALTVCGALVLLGRAIDGLGIQLAASRVSPNLSGWSGWGPILSGVALIAAASAFIRRELLDSSNRAMRRIVAGPVVFGVAILAALSLLLVGLRVTTSLAIVDQPANVASLSPKPELLRGAVEPPTARSDGAMMRAPANLLQPAIQKGVDGLRELREDYPRDPALLEALAVAHAAKPTGALQALDTLDALFAVVPAKARDERLAAIVTKASLGPANVAARALALMAQRMGQAGADQLYDLYVTSPAVRTAARAQLDDPRTREHFTPALAVAYDLRRTEGCADKRKLLQRAAEVGDDRSVTILQILSNPTRKGCGYRNRKPCPPPCAEQASELKRAASSIQNRLSAEAQSAKPGTKASHE